MAVCRPDGPASWAIASACFFINMMLYGATRLSGQLFVEALDRYSAPRDKVSFAFTFANFLKNTSGPFVGYFGQKFGVRFVTSFGCLLAAVGVGSCFLAENVATLTVLWGGLYGLGFGLGSVLLPIRINQYFDRHRATASGISFSGACVGSILLPPIVEMCLDTYGLSGTFLMMGGIFLNCVPAALLLREPDFTTKPENHQSRHIEEEKQGIRKNFKLYTVEDVRDPQERISELPVDLEISKNVDGYVQQKFEKRTKDMSKETGLIRMSSLEPLDFEDKIIPKSRGGQVNRASLNCNMESDHEAEHLKDYLHILQEDINDTSENSCSFICKSGNGCSAHFTSMTTNQQQGEDILSDTNLPSNDICHSNFKEKYNITQPSNYEYNSNIKKHFVKPSSSAFSLVFDPFFVLIALTNAVYFFSFVTISTVINDFARDIGVSDTDQKYVMMSLSVGDLIGRLGLGWITDDGHMTRTMFASLCFLCQGMATTAIAWSTGFTGLAVLAALYGLSEAGLIVIFPLIVAEFIDEDKQDIAIPSASFLSGPLCLTVGPIIGYFRDEIGSYKYIFYGIGLISALSSLAWLVTGCVVKYKRRKLYRIT